jgi:hypothetical protein
MDNLFLPRGVDAMNVDRALLRDVKALGGSPFTKEGIAFLKRLDDGKRCDRIQIVRPEAGKELAPAERVHKDGLFQFCECVGHAGMEASELRFSQAQTLLPNATFLMRPGQKMSTI